MKRRPWFGSSAVICAVAIWAAPDAHAAPRQGDAREVVAEIRVHGNHATADAEIIELSGVAIGDAFDEATLATVRERLRRTGRFVDVDVLKRYASIADLSRISIVIIVNEGPVRLVMPGEDDPDGEPRVVRRGFAGSLMWLPVLHVDDGYGATYGARVSYAGFQSDRSRLSFPLTWGGERRAGVEFDRTFATSAVSRVQLVADIRQQRNPAYEVNDRRQGVKGRVETVAGPVRAGGSVGYEALDFGSEHDDIRSVGADVAFDTRLNPTLPRNAVYARASWERLDTVSSGVLHRVRLEGEGFVGLWGQSVLALRTGWEEVNRPAPLYLRSLLGGANSLRGFRAGSFTGDAVATGSLELVQPLSSPLRVGQLGVSVFVDTGTAFEKGERLADQPWEVGYGGSVWLTFTAFRMSLAVAHGQGASTRVHFGAGFAF